MLYSFLADLTVVLHAAFVLFVVLGGLLVIWRPWIIWLHLPAALWGVWIEFTGGVCPLTPLEKRFRGMAGEASYSGGFVEHWLLGAIYPEGLTRTHQLVLGGLVILVNAAIYAFVFRKRRVDSAADLNR